MQILVSENVVNKSEEPALSEQDLKTMYRAMLATRMLDVKALGMQRQGRIGFYVPCSGQEATQVGSSFALREEDWTLPTYRDTGVVILRGISMKTIFDHLMGNSRDLMFGRQMPNHWGFKNINFVSIASTIAAHLPVATGIAMAIKMRKETKVVMAYHGDGATSEGDFHCAYNFAGVYKSPIVFICENNGWAISLPSTMQTASRTFAEKAEAYGFKGLRVDGNDVLAVYKASKEAVDNARKGGGPTMIECLTYRMGPHSTSDDPNRYRTKEEIEAWKRKDPIERFRSYLVTKGYWSQDYETQVKAEIEQEINSAIQEAERISPPVIDSMFSDVYSEMPANVKQQLDEEKASE
ncbi:MAG: pyruvate dehydrogenase (acetyl-transferring) E1 component subunit alpha [Nitrososphaerales archaeon]